jgi:hypothetical protein
MDTDCPIGLKRQDSTICCLQRIHLTNKVTHKLKVKGWKKIYQARGNWKDVGVAILKPDKVDFTQKSDRRDKQGHNMLIKGIIQ